MTFASYARTEYERGIEQSLSSTTKKQELLEKIKNNKKKQQATQKQLPQNTESDKYKSLYKKLKKEHEKLEKEFNQLKSEKQQNQHHDKSIQEQLRKTKEQNYQLTQHLEQMGIELKGADSLIFTLTKRAEDAELALSKQEKSTRHHIQVSENFRKKKKTYTSNITGLTRKLSKVKKHSADTAVRLKNAEKTINKLQKQVAIKDRNLSLLENQNPSKLIEVLFEQLTLGNMQDFKELDRLFDKWMLMKKHSQTEEVVEESNTSLLYGIVSIDSRNNKTFTDLTGQAYGVAYSPYVTNGSPVSAVPVGKNLVEIKGAYKTQELEMYRKKTVSNPKEKNSKPTVQYPQLGQGVKVLVLTGSSYGVKYRDYLNKHGFEANWHDAYEKSPVHTKVMMEKYDIVLLFWDSSPHLTLDFISEQDKKYQFVHYSKEEKILHRAYMTARELGLIEQDAN